MVQNQRALDRSVQEYPTYNEQPHSGLVMSIASVADDLMPWGQHTARRDRQLREFWPTEPILASAIYSIVARNAAFNWTLEGPPITVNHTQELLHQADAGRGWLSFVTKLTTDLLTQDNGAFVEVIRETDSPESPVLGVANLDALRCTRTGIPETPVLYYDRRGRDHLLQWYQVFTVEEFPSPIERMNNVQLCAVSRVLRAAQLLKDVSIYQREKLSGNSPNVIHLVGGIPSKTITDATDQYRDNQANQQLIRWMKPLVIASLDPTKTISHEQIDIKTLPDGFDPDVVMRWYISQLALGFGADYQDFAPLPGRALGSGAQSLILHMKSRGKGPALFMKLMEYKFNFHGVLPRNVTFSYDEQDTAAEAEEAEIEKVRAETHQIYLDTGVLTPEAARQQLLDDGAMTQEVFDSLQEDSDITPEVTAQDDERVDKGQKQELPPPEPVSDFAEQERLAAERELGDDMLQALARTFREVRAELRVKGLVGRRKDVDPNDLLSDAEFWEDFRIRMVQGMLPHAREIAGDAVKFNDDLGLAVNFDLVNDEVLEFSRTFTNTWWQQIERTTRDSMRKAIVTWQEVGLGDAGLPDLIASMEPLFGPERAKRIATTEVTRIFDEGNKLAHISAGITTEEWQTARDEHVDDVICEPLDTQRFPTDSGPRPVTDTHINCVLPGTPVIASGILAATRAWYEGPILELLTEGGNRLSVTPNHSILTPRGWLAAEALSPGCDVICGAFGQRPVARTDKDIANMPTVIEEIFNPFTVVDRKGITAPEFHGDGRFMDGYVDIVGADGQLRCACGASGFQPLHELYLVRRSIAERFLHSVGAQFFAGLRYRSTARRRVGAAGKMGSVGGRHLCQSVYHGLTAVAGHYASVYEPSADEAPRHTESLRDSQFRFTGAVAEHNGVGIGLAPRPTHGNTMVLEKPVEVGHGDTQVRVDSYGSLPLGVAAQKIVSIRQSQYMGHVYDLQTSMSLYQAAGLIVHNCRCARLPVANDGALIGGR